MKLCVYGGHYGSEGKGSASEWLLKHTKRDGHKLVAVGENSPNSGHTCSIGKTRNIPAASYFADEVLLGPDSAVDLAVLLFDLQSIRRSQNRAPSVFIHEHAAVVCERDKQTELESGIVASISSTGSGSGASRVLNKAFLRLEDSTIKHRSLKLYADEGFTVQILDRLAYLNHVTSLYDADCVFECSQGTLLDVNWGIHPFVTSRPTLPRVAIERNGLAPLTWAYFGVYRTFPIRTGGPSGPTGGKEITFSDIGVEPEIATVTKRTRRIFEFSREDFYLSVNLCRPACVMFTHLDYIQVKPDDLDGFMEWFRAKCGKIDYRVEGLFLSDSIGNFVNHGVVQL